MPTTLSLPSVDVQVIQRYLSTRPTALTEIHAAGDLWKAIADEVLRRRLMVAVDALSNETLRAIASGEIDFPSVCDSLME